MSDKIETTHRERVAFVYIRQSTLHQVRNNLESQRRQYELRARAQELGFSRIEIIDEDLGISGTGTQERPGFGKLLAAVCQGQAGAVVAMEASRLARNNRDWHHLIDLCVLTDTLVIDADGVYDPRVLNDRLLLGLKGTMSEFELGLLRQRAQEAFREKIARGEVLFAVPIGYVRTEIHGVEKTPDQQIQQAIQGVFEQFERLGSVRQVLLWYRQENLRTCTLERRAGAAEVVWKLPGYNRLHAILTNPIYAGAFVYGRHQTRSTMVEGRSRKTSGHALPMEEWSVLIRDHHPGYICWEQYLKNQETITGNRAKYHASTKGAVQRGSALLSGLLRCARCGRKLHVCYSGNGGRVARYHCRGAHINHGTEKCLSFGSLRPDQAITELTLEALQPLGVEAALLAWEKLRDQEDLKIQSLRLALEKAHYEADRLGRQFEAVDPANRLVAGELESRWNQALAEVEQIQRNLQTTQSAVKPVGQSERERLLRLGSDVRRVWGHSNTPITLKKRLLRTLIEEIVVDVDESARQLSFKIHWTGGVHTALRIPKHYSGGHGRTTDADVVELVRELVQVSSDASIAWILNRLGYKTGNGNTWTESRISSLRHQRNIPGHQKLGNGSWITLTAAAQQLQVSPAVIRKLIASALLPAKQVVEHAPWVIKREDLELKEVQEYIEAVHAGKRIPRRDHNQDSLPL